MAYGAGGLHSYSTRYDCLMISARMTGNMTVAN